MAITHPERVWSEPGDVNKWGGVQPDSSRQPEREPENSGGITVETVALGAMETLLSWPRSNVEGPELIG